MAVTTVANVRKASATGDVITGPHRYNSVKVINSGVANSVVTLKKGSSSGAVIWQSGTIAASGIEQVEVDIALAADIYVDISVAGPVVYLYSK
jgi:hypothetical protein